jgi:predicted nucleotidyltransferase
VYILNIHAIRSKARDLGFRGVKPLLEHLGLHRNTLNRFANGSPILPHSVDRILSALQISLSEAIIQSSPQRAETDDITPLVERIHRRYPDVSVFLFGSRARRKSRRYSDFDLGVFTSGKLPLSTFLDILEQKEKFEEGSPHRVDCVNLTDASPDFLREISPDLILLAGYERDRLEIVQRANEIKPPRG